MLITFTGRKSGKVFTTPVRYIRNGETVRCFTSSENQWWRNLRGGGDVTLLIEGKSEYFHAVASQDDPAKIRKWLLYYLGMFPQDAVYHGIRLEEDKRVNSDDLDQASRLAVLVEATPLPGPEITSDEKSI